MQSVWGCEGPHIAQSHMLSEATNGRVIDIIQTYAGLFGMG